MLDDGDAVPPGTTLRPAVCVVGAGAAGITLARELARGGRHDVVVLESGGTDHEPETQRLAEGTSRDLPYDLAASRLRMLGGSTNHWAGWCRPLDDEDFERRDWVEPSGWPFARSELVPYYRRAQDVCELGPFRYDVAWWRDRLAGVAPLLDTAVVRTAIFQVGPATAFGAAYRDELARAPKVRVLLHANAVNLRTEGGRVTGVDVATLAGNRFSVVAPIVVLATGGIENARLLLASREERPSGLGNDHDLVGRYFMDHPHFFAGRFVLTDRAPEARLHFSVGVPFAELSLPDPPGRVARSVLGALALTPSAAREAGVPGLALTLVPPHVGEGDDVEVGIADVESLLGDVEGRSAQPSVPRAETIYTGETVLLTKRVGIYVRAEPTPFRESRVELGEDVDALGVPWFALAWRLHPDDPAAMARGLQAAARELGVRGLGRAYLSGFQFGPWEGGNHHMGTTRMHRDARLGVVDGDGQVHGVAGLYVAGSSVFPVAGFANPTLTIVALSLRLARHLDRRLRR